MLATASLSRHEAVTIRVKGMKCGNARLPSPKHSSHRRREDVEVSSAKGEAVITYDDEKVNEPNCVRYHGTGFKAEDSADA